MGIIVAVGSSKGGVGKTAVCQMLAPTMMQRGWRVAVVDADQNGTFSRWFTDAYEGPKFACVFEPHATKSVNVTLGLLADAADIVLIDTAGFKNLTASAAMTGADLVLIPCMADRGSVTEAIATHEQVLSLARMARREIQAFALCTRWRGRGLAERAARDGLEANSVPVLDRVMSDLADFAKLTHSGRVPTVGKAAVEADRIIDELVSKKLLPPLPKKHSKAMRSRRSSAVSGTSVSTDHSLASDKGAAA